MESAAKFFLPGYLPLFIVSTFSSIIFIAVIVAMIGMLIGFYRSNINSYTNKIKALGLQITDMQLHLDYASHEETKARADAKRSAAAREKLLISLSHEIRTPMNGILGMTILLEETNLNPEQRDYIDTIISSGKILLNKVDEVMANDMLEQSKIDRSIHTAQQKNTNLRNCVEEVLDTFAVKAAEKKIELLYQIDAEVPAQVLTDSGRLYKILTNLVENVMKDNQQQVFIGVHVIRHNSVEIPPALGFTIAEKPLGNTAAIALLLETGKGMSDKTDEEALDDQRLGLTISKKLVEEMSGGIKAIADNSSGFIFSIPLHHVAAGNTSITDFNLKDFENKQVLIVNNNVTAAAILKNQLQQWKLEAVVVGNANEALQITAEQNFSLVIIEMNLPGTNGIQLAAHMKDAYPGVPLILLNALHDNCYKDQENLAGEITVLSKPLKQHNLFDHILSIFRDKKTGQMQDMSVKKLSADFAKQYPLSILVAEDNPVNQKWASKILGKLGYTVDIAENGHIALDMVSKTSYDLILMDVQMPGMDGLEATKMIRVCLNKQPTIIAMTANVMHGDRMACMQAGMDDYISKPVQLGELVNMLEKWALVITEKKFALQNVN
jgi:CheY-like chemotaxis protein/signal transduction histidine kinase